MIIKVIFPIADCRRYLGRTDTGLIRMYEELLSGKSGSKSDFLRRGSGLRRDINGEDYFHLKWIKGLDAICGVKRSGPSQSEIRCRQNSSRLVVNESTHLSRIELEFDLIIGDGWSALSFAQAVLDLNVSVLGQNKDLETVRLGDLAPALAKKLAAATRSTRAPASLDSDGFVVAGKPLITVTNATESFFSGDEIHRVDVKFADKKRRAELTRERRMLDSIRLAYSHVSYHGKNIGVWIVARPPSRSVNGDNWAVRSLELVLIERHTMQENIVSYVPRLIDDQARGFRVRNLVSDLEKTFGQLQQKHRRNVCQETFLLRERDHVTGVTKDTINSFEASDNPSFRLKLDVAQFCVAQLTTKPAVKFRRYGALAIVSLFEFLILIPALTLITHQSWGDTLLAVARAVGYPAALFVIICLGLGVYHSSREGVRSAPVWVAQKIQSSWGWVTGPLILTSLLSMGTPLPR